MADLTTFAGTFNRSAAADEPGMELYVRSYLLIRTVVGVLGIALPLVLIVGESFFLKGSAEVRGSLSAYYHSPMRDFFVGSLCVIGVLLITYMAARVNADFWASLVAGVFLIGVAFIPTERPGISDTAPPCGTDPKPPDCASVQQLLGEVWSARIHYTCAAIALVSLAVIAFLFAWREKHFAESHRLYTFHLGCCIAIVAGLLLAVAGEAHHFTIWVLTPLYIGEVVAVLAFGLGWLVKGWDLWKALVPGSG